MTEKDKRERVGILPFFGAVLLFFANVDLIIIPYLKSLNLSFWMVYWIAMVLANSEIIGWFHFWRWFAWKWLPTTEPVKDAVELTKSIIVLLKEYGLLGTVIYKVRQTFQWANNEKSRKTLEKWGHFWMFFLGAEPFFSGGRLIGVISCGATRWKKGLISLCLGNAIHVYISIKTWDLLFYLWETHKREFITTAIIILVLYIFRYFFKKRQKN